MCDATCVGVKALVVAVDRPVRGHSHREQVARRADLDGRAVRDPGEDVVDGRRAR